MSPDLGHKDRPHPPLSTVNQPSSDLGSIPQVKQRRDDSIPRRNLLDIEIPWHTYPLIPSCQATTLDPHTRVRLRNTCTFEFRGIVGRSFRFTRFVQPIFFILSRPSIRIILCVRSLSSCRRRDKSRPTKNDTPFHLTLRKRP